MERKRELYEIVLDIQKEIAGFNRDELINYITWAIPRLYDSVRHNEKIDVKCDSELINKLNKENTKYRINKDIDHLSVQFAELTNNYKQDDEMYIQVYLSLFFYDNVKNNTDDNSLADKYWNDIWIVTVKKDYKPGQKQHNCSNCGAVLKYNQARNIFQCEYCGNIIHNNSDSQWKIVNIEIQK